MVSTICNRHGQKLLISAGQDGIKEKVFVCIPNNSFIHYACCNSYQTTCHCTFLYATSRAIQQFSGRGEYYIPTVIFEQKRRQANIRNMAEKSLALNCRIARKTPILDTVLILCFFTRLPLSRVKVSIRE